MKKLICAATALMMTAAMFCGCRNTGTDRSGMVTESTGRPTVITEPAATTVPHTTTIPHETTVPNVMDDMTDAIDDFMGGTSDTTTGSERSTGRAGNHPAR